MFSSVFNRCVRYKTCNIAKQNNTGGYTDKHEGVYFNIVIIKNHILESNPYKKENTSP